MTDRTGRPRHHVEVLIERHEALIVLRGQSGAALGPTDLADLTRALSLHDGVTTVFADSHAVGSSDFWSRLAEVLDELKSAGAVGVRLAVTGAGDERPGRPATARWVADAWKLPVEAPDGAAFVVPGGSLYVVGPAGGPGAWHRFLPGTRAATVGGARCPAPAWQAAVEGVPPRTAGGCTVHHIPAGLVLRPEASHAVRSDDIYHAVPVDPERPTIVVLPGTSPVPVPDLLSLLRAAPQLAAFPIRLAPGGPHDVLPLAQGVADALDTEIEVSTGLPLIIGIAATGRDAARSVLIRADGSPGWVPFVDAVACQPSTVGEPLPEPRLVRWTPPLRGAAATGDGMLGTVGGYRVEVTRSGLRVSDARTALRADAFRQVSDRGPVIEVGVPGVPLAETVWTALSRVLGDIDPEVREQVMVHVHGTPVDRGAGLRRLADRFGLPRLWDRSAVGAPYLPPDVGSLPLSRGPARPMTRPEPPGGADVTWAEHRSPVPRTELTGALRPAWAVDVNLEGAWDHLSGGRPAAPPRPALEEVPRPACGPDLEEAWNHLSRQRARTEPRPEAEPLGAPGGPVIGRTPERAPAVPEAARAAAARVPRLGYRSTYTDRSALRVLVGPAGSAHTDNIDQAVSRLGLLGEAGREAAAADLTALGLYLDADSEEAALSHAHLARALRAGDDSLYPYAACLVSSLRLVPAYRGIVLRGAGPGPAVVDTLEVGGLLQDPAPVSGIVLGPGKPTALPRGPRYAVWSVTGRRLRRAFPGADDEVLFAPDTPFRVLEVRRAGVSPVVLLRELPPHGAVSIARSAQEGPVELDEADHAAQLRLDESLKSLATSGDADWPERCAGPVGQGP
ncbi:hypothetical protein K7472_19185 [Streptomyces sp. PTM05]|uniref:Uncharacterized protein n=1 Tax=Streptantibioticus parmotrematis TaxID=2873249 RepID=A0ABS7QX76_9ACTN|nr:hypothetical protein [Streptantibioticus parmotrematis]MBY8886965.1 hypothetical protein [Streptantibioticus parmotrematis]